MDTNGAIVAMIAKRLTGSRYVYLSLELRDPRDAWPFSAAINMLERLAYRNADAVIIQDQDRLQTLNRYLAFDHPYAFYLPNSPSGSVMATESATGEPFLRRILGISPAEFSVIALQAGMIDRMVFSEELAASFRAIERDWALVFHERVKRDINEPMLRQLRQLNPRNLFLSLDPVSLADVDKVYQSATIGLAFYRESDANFGQISMASGKLAFYLKHGKPILASNTASLAAFVDRTGAGIVIHDPTDRAELENAIDRLLADYAGYSARARQSFDREFDFDRNVVPVLDLLDRVAEPGRTI